MKLKEFENKGPLRQVTLALLFKEDQILLAMKKRGFGQGKWNGVGGKQDVGETIEETAVRETREEIGVEITKFTQVGRISFYSETKPETDQEVTIFKVDEWNGEPTESEEMAPRWFPIDQIPYESMWPDDVHWLPLAIRGKKFEASFLFGKENEIEDMKITEIE